METMRRHPGKILIKNFTISQDTFDCIVNASGRRKLHQPYQLERFVAQLIELGATKLQEKEKHVA